MSLFEELKRRNVFRVGIAYVLGAWVSLQIVDFALQVIAAPDWILQVFFLAALLGLVAALIAAWIFEVTPEGIRREADIDRSRSITPQTGRKLDRTIIIFLGLAVVLLLADRFIGAGGEQAATEAPAAVTQPAPAAPEAEQSPEKSIAVLPFENRSPNAEDEFFADGMHDELLTHLSKISGLQVISRTSVMGYADTDRRIPEIARELGVANIMEGSVQRAGKRVRINVQLIDAQRDVHLWAEIYDRELTAENIFDIQSEITKAIAAALNSALSSDNERELQARPTTVLAAYDAYVAGRLLFNRMTPSGFRQAIGLFDKAIAEDPGFAAAWSAKSEALLELYWLFDIGNPELVETARGALDRARVLAPDTVETQNAMAHFSYYALLDYDRAIAEFDRVLERAPSLSRAWAGKGFAMRRAGRFAEAIDALEQAHVLDPLAIDPMDGIMHTSALLGRFERAWEMLGELSTVAPANPVTVLGKSMLYARVGDAQRCWEAVNAPVNDPGPAYYASRLSAAVGTRDAANVDSSLEDWPESLRTPDRFPETYHLKKAEALLVLGRKGEASELLSETKARIESSANPYPHGWAANGWYYPIELPGLMGDLAAVDEVVAAYEADPPTDQLSRYDVHFFLIAKAYAFAGDPESALDYLERQVDRLGPARFMSFAVEPAFEALQSHPRFQAMGSRYRAWQAEQSK